MLGRWQFPVALVVGSALSLPTTSHAAPAASDGPDGTAASRFDDDEPTTDSEGEAYRLVPLPRQLAELSGARLQQVLAERPAALGPLSVGWTNSGLLLNAVQLPPGDRYAIMDPSVAWATEETIAYLRRAIDAVHEAHPGSPRLYVGHLSQRRGGRLTSHKSHQSGRDVDVDYFHTTPEPRFYRPTNADNLDRPRTWTFVRALVTHTDVQMVFIDTSIQRLLKEYALSIGEDPQWLDAIFEYDSKQPNPIIRHARGHQTHIHIRFYSPIAQEMGRRAYPALVAMGRIKPQRYFVSHRVHKGDTLGKLARKYDTTVEAIQRANGLKSTVIIQNKSYRIPQRGRVRPAPGPVRIPQRRLPPPPRGRPAAPGGDRAAAP